MWVNFFRLLFTNPRAWLIRLLTRKRLFKSDNLQIKILYWLEMGILIDIDKPKGFNQKLQWLKLHDRNPLYTTLVDKYAVKQYVANIIGNEYIIPTLGMWENVEDIDFNLLPNQFVLKVTHGGGGSGVSICRNKDTYNKKKELARLKKWLSTDGYLGRCEWPYKNVPRRIIAEKYMVDMNHALEGLIDYKFYCFNGIAKYMMVCTDRYKGNTKFFYFDQKREFIPFDVNNKIINDEQKNKLLPSHLDEMFNIAERLSKGIPHVRLDLYNINGKIYFSEYTFYSSSGFDKDITSEADGILGDLIELPIKNNN